MNALLKLVRPKILAMKAYESARSLQTQGRIFLDANESPFCPVGKALNRYPEPQPREILQRFSALYGVPSENILVGRGADEAIDLIVRTFCESGRDAIMTCAPTYGFYEICASIQDARVLYAPLKCEGDDFKLDIENIKTQLLNSTSLKVIFLCSPNNPTGTRFSEESLVEICEFTKERCILVIDEAYCEFSQQASMTRFLCEYDQLLILKTLSKAWSLAGVRCGCVIGNETLIQILQKVRAPYPLSRPAIEEVLRHTDSNGENVLKKRVENIRQQRAEMKKSLEELAIVQKIYDSDTNFLLVRFRDAKQVMSYLSAAGLIVRDRSSDFGLENCIRITMGTEEENRSVVSLLSVVNNEF